MRITFDEAFDSGTWPGPGAGKAAAGELWVGHSGLLGVLEGLTGLSRIWPSHAARVAALVPRLAAASGFWSASAKTDALSTAERLIDLRDALTLHGWSNGVKSARLKQLASLTLVPELGGSPGERLETLAACVLDFPRLVDQVTLLVPRDSLPVRLGGCLAALEKKGTEVLVAPPPVAAAAKDSDLARAKLRATFAPARDGSLQLVRPFAPLVAADTLAAALAADPETRTLIVGADAVLDQALARHGLPTVGGAGDPSDNAVLQLLPLVVAMGAKPQDPERVVELLTLPTSPVPRRIARRLVRALQSWPAVGSPDWDRALTEGLEEIADVEDRAAAAERLSALFAGTVTSTVFPVTELFTRTQALRTWLLGREAHSENDEASARFGSALIQCAEFEELLRASNATRVTTPQLKLFLERATASVDGSQRYSARAGLSSVGDPGGVAGPVPRIVWWNFTLDSAPGPRGVIWSKAERAALAAGGVRVPSPGEQARSLSLRFRRPLDQATHALWLVCPQAGPDATEAAPHPLWDEVLGALGDSRHARALTLEKPVVTSPLPERKRRPLPLPQPRPTWQTKHKLKKRELESPSSVEALLGCAFHWTLRYVGDLKSGQTAELSAEKQLLGKLAHEVVGQTLAARPASPAAAGADAEKRFATLGPSLAAPLFLPGRDAERGEALRAARAAAFQLALLLDDGWKVDSVEQPYRGKALGTELEGRLDLVLKKGATRAVVDLKWSGERYRRETLEAGAAVQLAAYAELLRQAGADDVPVGYFILVSQALLSADKRLATKSSALTVTHDAASTWASAEQAWKAAWKQAASGTLSAPGVTAGALEQSGRDEAGELAIAPPCKFCDYAGLCGRLYGVIAEDADGED